MNVSVGIHKNAVKTRGGKLKELKCHLAKQKGFRKQMLMFGNTNPLGARPWFVQHLAEGHGS